MRVLLIDCDLTRFGNLVLMKLSAYHKARGDEVFLGQAASWDKCYASCAFTFNSHKNTCPLDATKGGSGFGLWGWLPDEVEHRMPDYRLYGHDLGYSMGFTSRGCIRNCPWCVVPKKEGKIRAWAEIYEFWDRRHRRMKLLDNNLLAAPNAKETLEDLAQERVLVDFNQGLDIRLVTDEFAYLLKKVRFSKVRFSFDEPTMEVKVREGIEMLRAAGIAPQRVSFYILIGFDTHYTDDLERLRIIESYGADPFIMLYQEVNDVKPRVLWDGLGTAKEFARWVNVKKLHRHTTYRQWLNYRGCL